MNISKEELRKIIKEEIEKVVVDNIVNEGFTARDAAAAPEVKQKLAEYGLDVDSYSDKDIANMMMEFITSFGTRIVSVEDTIRMIDSRYSPEGSYKLNKPEDRPTPEKDMARSKKPLTTMLDDPNYRQPDYEPTGVSRRSRTRRYQQRMGFPKPGDRNS